MIMRWPAAGLPSENQQLTAPVLPDQFFVKKNCGPEIQRYVSVIDASSGK